MTQENLKEMRERIKHLNRYLALDDKRAKMENDRQLTLAPGFWDDNARATGILKEIKINKYWIDLFEQVNTAVEDFAVLFDFWKEGEATEEPAAEESDAEATDEAPAEETEEAAEEPAEDATEAAPEDAGATEEPAEQPTEEATEDAD